VTGVARGGPAERGGLRTKDVILSIDDIPAIGVRQALDYITQTAPGSKIKVEVSRGGEKLMLTMLVAELNA
jgi:S1-C subfamily serine protease